MKCWDPQYEKCPVCLCVCYSMISACMDLFSKARCCVHGGERSSKYIAAWKNNGTFVSLAGIGTLLASRSQGLVISARRRGSAR